MRVLRHLLAGILGAAYVVAFLSGVGCSDPPEHEGKGLQLFESSQADPLILSPDGTRLYQALTTTGRVRVINTATLMALATIEVGVDPVSLAVRPDGSELWVANHVSDSISVISLAAGPDQHRVVETIQAVDAANLITDFDEPVGIAFASNEKAYVALSSRNQIAIVDANSYQVTGFLAMNAQEPRAMRVRGGLLFVPAFESGNRSELSSCVGAPPPPDPNDPESPQCTFDFTQANFAQNPQLVGFDVDIAKDPVMPDRDLFVFDTTTDAQVAVVSGIGTLLFGLAVDSGGTVFIAQTDARNAANGRAGTQGQGLADLDNRIFLNQVGVVDCSGGSCDAPSVFELEPLPPTQPQPGRQLATPYAIEISGNDQVLVGTAASSNRVFTLSASSGAVLDVLDVGNGPRGLALRSDPATGAPLTAYVLNTLDDSITKIDVSDPANIVPVEGGHRAYNGDGTPLAIRNGRIAFNSAAASTTGTFSCASCHPDGHVDQLLWVIGAQCTFSGCDQEEPRLTMPVRGLKNTNPLHWDGTLGDPFSGRNGETGATGNAPRNCTADQDCFRHLVNASLAGVMCDQAGCPTNEIGQAGGLSDAERDAMATYLQNIQYPPARTRRFDDQLTAQAVAGFSDFFENKGGVNPPGPGGAGPETCGDVGPGGCHALPHGAGTASFFVGGFEAPTLRGITDRFAEFSAGVTVVRDVLEAVSPNGTEAPWTPAIGFDEFTTWAVAFGSPSNNIGFRSAYNVRAFDIFRMIEEMSNGQSGAFARQVTLNLRSTTGGALAVTEALLGNLEAADLRGLVNLQGSGLRNGAPVTLSFRSDATYRGGGLALTHAQLIGEAQAGTTTLTLTAFQRANVSAATLQPTLFVRAVFESGTGTFASDGRPDLPILPGDDPMVVLAEDVPPGAKVLIDGVPVGANVTCIGATVNGLCDASGVRIDLLDPPTAPDLYLLQVQAGDGLLSNELPIRVGGS